jgi:hypothetical protein
MKLFTLRKGAILFSLLLVLPAAACSYQSVSHLNRQQWMLDERRCLEMNYLDFRYICRQSESGVSLRGRAFPRTSALPSWASWTKEIWLGAYLSDKDGKLLAKQIKLLPQQKFRPHAGYPFHFQLRPRDVGKPGPVYISFGYRLVLTPASSEEGSASGEQEETNGEERVFFASESALTRF